MPQKALTPKSAVPPEHLAFVNFLRGVACLWVLLFHANNVHVLPDWTTREPLLEPLANVCTQLVKLGYLGVHLFLVLSGFCLTYPLLRRATGGEVAQTRLNLRDFAWRRLRRILPPYYVALLLVSLAALAIPDSPLSHPTIWWGWDVLAHALLVHNLHYKTILTLNGSFWSLGLEMQWYLCFPLMLAWARRQGWLSVLLGALVLGVVWQRLTWARLADYPAQPELLQGTAWLYALPARLFEFVCGMVAAQYVVQRKTKVALPGLVILLPLLVLEGVSATGRFGVWHDHLWGGAFALLLVTFAVVPESWFARRVPRTIEGVGTFSYSLYLVHQPILAFIMILSELLPTKTPWVITLVFWVGVLPFCLLTAWVFYHCFEAPWLKKKAPDLAVVSQDAAAGAAHACTAQKRSD